MNLRVSLASLGEKKAVFNRRCTRMHADGLEMRRTKICVHQRASAVPVFHCLPGRFIIPDKVLGYCCHRLVLPVADSSELSDKTTQCPPSVRRHSRSQDISVLPCTVADLEPRIGQLPGGSKHEKSSIYPCESVCIRGSKI